MHPVPTFHHICELLASDASRTVLTQFYESLISRRIDEAPDDADPRTKRLRKSSQRRGVVRLLQDLPGYESMVEVGCGKGKLANEILLAFPERDIMGIDKQQDLVDRGQRENPGIRLVQANAWKYQPENVGAVVGLHTCGALVDRTIAMAAEQDADVVVAPCCYGKVGLNDRRINPYQLPRSKALQQWETKFLDCLRSAKRMEGLAQDHKNTRVFSLIDLTRMAVNLDRMLWLQERGYDARFVEITGTQGVRPNGEKFYQSQLRQAIVGTK